ncbi:MAG: imelysin family protein [Gammaproteobacteria bacterium]|nr:imelysin family protein [Gammaproteobacteria bacterium]
MQTASAALVRATERFLASPRRETRAALQSAWHDAHREYAATLLLLPQNPASQRTGPIDTWPIEPGFLDSLPGYPDSGLINDTTITIDARTMRAQHGFTDPSEASLGFHPIEYYAFTRPLSDFEPDPFNDSIDRRRRALRSYGPGTRCRPDSDGAGTGFSRRDGAPGERRAASTGSWPPERHRRSDQ